MQRTPVRFLGREDPLEKVIGCPLQYSWASLVLQVVKNLPAVRENWLGKIPWRRACQPTPVFLRGWFRGQKSPYGYSPCDRRVRHHWATQHSTSVTNGLHICSLQFTWVHFSTGPFFPYFFYRVFLSNINFPVIFNLVDNDSTCGKVCLYKALCVGSAALFLSYNPILPTGWNF